MKTGDIVLIPFPFSELTEVKLRPAVVITQTNDKYKDLVLSAISSQIPISLSATEILVKPEPSNGLRTGSIIKVDRIFTLKAEKVIARIGKLSTQELTIFKLIFKSLVD